MPKTYVWDQFTGSGALSSHSMNIGSGWTAQQGTWTLNGSGKVTCTATAGDNQNVATCDIGITDAMVVCDIDMTIGVNPSDPGVVFRFSDNNNYWVLTMTSAAGMTLYSRESGTFNNRGFGSNPFIATTYTVMIGGNGNNIFVYLQPQTKVNSRTQTWADSLTYTSSFNNTATQAGIRTYLAASYVTASFDNFRVFDFAACKFYDIEVSGATQTSPGFTSLVETSTYSVGVSPGYSAGSINSADRAISSMLWRDMNYFTSATLKIDVTAGTYDVSVHIGDAGVSGGTNYPHDSQQVKLQGNIVATISTGNNEIDSSWYSSIDITSGTLTIQMDDTGGSDPFMCAVAVVILPTPALSSSFIIAHRPLRIWRGRR